MPLCETIISTLNHLPPDDTYARDERSEALENLQCFSLALEPDITWRKMEVHDALAMILVSKKKEEIIAVGSSQTNERLTLYVACNGRDSNLNNAKKHLEFVWSSLKNIRNIVPSISRSSPVPVGWNSEDVVHMQREFQYMIYQHHMPKFIQRLKHGKSMGLDVFFKRMLKDGSAYVHLQEAVDNSEETVSDLKNDFDEPFIYSNQRHLVVALDSLYALMVEYVGDTSNQDLLKRLVHSIASTLRKLKEEDHGSGYDLPFNHDTRNFFDQCNDILREVTDADQVDDPSGFRRFWEKAFSLQHAVERLIRLVYSGRLGHLLDCEFEVIGVLAQSNILQYDIESDAGFREILSSHEDLNEFMNESRKLRSNRMVYTHYECTLQACFQDRNIDAFGYIGVSKLSCRACSWYFEAYNQLTRNGKKYYTHGCHGKQYAGWTYARISDNDLNEKLEWSLCSKARIDFNNRMGPPSTEKATDSTDVSGPSVAFLDDTT